MEDFWNFDNYMADLQKEMDRQMKQILEQAAGSERPAADNRAGNSPNTTSETSTRPNPEAQIAGPKPLERLRLHDALEESSKTRIGTFERIYAEIFAPQTGRPIRFGYEDLDFSPLVTLLAGALETELNRSIYRMIRNFARTSGEPNAEIVYRGRTIDLSRQTQTLGCFPLLMARFRKELDGFIHHPEDFGRPFEKIIAYRNRASHSSDIDQREFLTFYEIYARLFNRHIDELMEMKSDARKYVFATPSEPAFDAEEQAYIDSILGREQSEPTSEQVYEPPRKPTEDQPSAQMPGTENSVRRREGIILTNCASLAVKYYGCINDTISVSSDGMPVGVIDLIRNTILEYVGKCRNYGVEYHLLDLALENPLTTAGDWRSCARLLSEFVRRNGLSTENRTMALFIIGGDDVIPMPRVPNPCYDANDAKQQKNITERDLDADLLYAYDFNDVTWQTGQVPDLARLFSCQPRFVPGRLPLEEGFMESDFKTDIRGYLERALLAFAQNGISLKKRPVITSCESSRNIARIMTDALPLEQLDPIDGYIENNMIISPLYELRKALPCPSGEPVDPSAERCLDAQMTAEMLLFMLHGSPQPLCAEYSGERDASCHPVAFHSDQFRLSRAQCVAAICCYGARFVGYKRQYSPLLQAIYNQTLLFMGACRSAFGHFDCHLQLDEIKHPLSASELLLRYYLTRLLSGMDAGEALLAAKTDYVRFALRNKTAEQPDILVTTILEFNLFGDPLLHVQPLISHPKNSPSEETSASNRNFIFGPIPRRSYTTLFNREHDGNIPLSEKLRNLVDHNFEEIHEFFTRKLYETLEIPPSDLHSIRRFESDGRTEGYSFCYRKEEMNLTLETRVETDSLGHISSVVGSF